MLWVISRTPSPTFAGMREQGLQAHRDYFKSQKHILVMAGVLVNDDDQDISGTLLIVNVGSRAEAQAFADGDPFQKAGMFSRVTITRMRRGQWNPAAGENV